MDLSTRRFLDAFGGDSSKQEKGQQVGDKYGPDARTEAFVQAFGRKRDAAAPVPHLGQSFRWDMSKISRLSFEEQFYLQQYENASFRSLPSWIIDGKYAIPSREEMSYQKQALKETGLTQGERNLAFDLVRADLESIDMMAKSEVLRGSSVLDKELQSCIDKHGPEFRNLLREKFPEADSYFEGRDRMHAAEVEAQQEQAQAKAVKEEVQEAAEALGITPQQLDAMRRGSEVDE